MHHYHNLDDLTCEKLKGAVSKLSPGCFVIGLEMAGGKHVECVTMHVFLASNMSTMISKENLYSLQMRHCTPEEREVSRKIFEESGMVTNNGGQRQSNKNLAVKQKE